MINPKTDLACARCCKYAKQGLGVSAKLLGISFLDNRITVSIAGELDSCFRRNDVGILGFCSLSKNSVAKA